MTAPLDFAMLPPEINSARMYIGAGSGPMLAAAAAWHGLAAELQTTALGYHSVVSDLTSQAWYGPASASMAAAAAPYAAWLSTTAVQAEETAAQAEAAVAAYEAAFAATVPPPAIATNRARLMALIATNFLGQNTPAIAATEAEYTEMWAQDAAAMYGYAGSSAAATRLTAFTAPEQTTSPSATTAQSASVTQAASTPAGTAQSTLSPLIAATPNALGELAGWNPFAPGSAGATTGLNGLLNSVFGTNTAFGQMLNANIWNTIFASAFFMPARFLGTAADFMAMNGQAGPESTGDAAVGAVPGSGAGPAGSVGAVGDSVAASVGERAVIGPLSVPPSWIATEPLRSPLASTLGGAPLEAPPQTVAASAPPLPLANAGAQGEGRAMPQYGFRPSFVPRPPAAG